MPSNENVRRQRRRKGEVAAALDSSLAAGRDTATANTIHFGDRRSQVPIKSIRLRR